MRRLWIEQAEGFGSGRKFEGFAHRFLDITNSPFPAVVTRVVNLIVEDDGMPDGSTQDSKPPYRVPLMSEIAALPWNGLKVASTFSGAGGSCTGYRMAGYRVVWANEFLVAAQESYRANHPDSVLDCRDIRLVRPEEILEATGLRVGELDLFDGSPPCQAFSTAGKRAKGWGEAREYENGAKQCNELLFVEYVRLLKGLMPRTFVAENVSGLVKGVAKGFFKETLRDLKACGYRVTARLLDAQWLGVPQARQRIIFVGVREDLGLDPAHPSPLAYRYTVRDALPGIQRLKVRTFKGDAKDVTHEPMGTIQCTAQRTGLNRKQTVLEDSPTIMAGGPGTSGELEFPHEEPDRIERRKFTIDELKRICAFPDDYILTGSYAQQWERLGNSVPPVMMQAIAAAIRDNVLLRANGYTRTQTNTDTPETDPRQSGAPPDTARPIYPDRQMPGLPDSSDRRSA